MNDHPVLREEREWEAAVGALFVADAALLAVSRYIGDSRVYTDGERVALIRRVGSSAPRGVLGLAHEAEVLRRIGREAEYREADGWEVLKTEYVAGETLEQGAGTMSRLQRVRAVLRLIPRLRRLHARGVAHRDLRFDNVMLSGGDVDLLDFDRALITTPRQAAIADWIGITRSGMSFYPYWKLLLFAFEPKVQSAARRLSSRVRAHHAGPHGTADVRSQRLREAWQFARRSSANAPGQGVAYYAFTYRGEHFPGERPWYLRWEAVRSHVDFSGKKVLELGCNMGLWSSFAVIHGGSTAHGVDLDKQVLRAAELVAWSLDVPATFDQIDLTAPGWEEQLTGYDIVFAMSLLHWLPDPKRLLTFLGHQREIVFEGHDDLATEIARLKSLGFSHVDPLLQTERGRWVLHARK